MMNEVCGECGFIKATGSDCQVCETGGDCLFEECVEFTAAEIMNKVAHEIATHPHGVKRNYALLRRIYLMGFQGGINSTAVASVQ